ncbi:MAG: hypothetical protein ACM3RX_08265 [Methanococcaceae archaeon]
MLREPDAFELTRDFMNKIINIRNLFTFIFFTAAVMTASSDTVTAQKKNGKNVLHTVEKKHKFSSGKSKDLFRLTLIGKDTLNSVIIFEIMTEGSHIIYKEEFPAAYLIGYEGPAHKDSCRQIIERMNKFFAEKNFIIPSINKKDTFDPEASDKKIWEDISSDSNAIGFSYIVYIGEPANKQISYSRRADKVVLYRNYN